MERGRDIDVSVVVSILPFPSRPSLAPPRSIYLRERKCQRCHLNPLTGGGCPRTMKVRPRTEKVILRNDSGHSPREFGQRVWSKYLKNVDGYDKRLTDGWKDDANGVLVFVSLHLPVSVSITVTIWETGLFSAIVASFIIESYKLLSPDSGSQSVFLLGQLSQQFAGFANGTYVQPQPYLSSPPSPSIICINIWWLLSFLLSTMSALFATLMLQWARIYIDLPRTLSASKECARVCSILFFGTEKYRMHLAVTTAPTLIHLSVFLFFTGLVIFFFTISKSVANVILISVGFFGLAYFALTILPCIDYHCPYRTPMSSVLWYIYHTSLFSVALFLRWLLRLLHRYLVPYNFGDVTSFRQRILTRCFQTIDSSAKKHQQNLMDGFWRSIVQGALDAPVLVDLKALTWLFWWTGLAETSKVQEFVANIPGGTIVQLMSGPIKSGRIVFRDHLLSLLRSCTPGTVWLDEGMRRRRLLVCLNAIHHIAKASTLPTAFRHPSSSKVSCGLTLQISVLCDHSGPTSTLPSASSLVPSAHCSQDTFCAKIGSKGGS